MILLVFLTCQKTLHLDQKQKTALNYRYWPIWADLKELVSECLQLAK